LSLASGNPESELEYPPELDELLELPALPASCNPPGAAGFTSPEPGDEELEPAGCSPGYGNCCVGLFGASGVLCPPCCGCGVVCFGVGVSLGYGNCCAAFDGTGLSCAAGQFDVVVIFPSLPMVADPVQFIGPVGASGVLPSGVCFHWLSFC
jgi:hypothetical protein